MEDKQVEKTLRIPLELPVVLVTVQVFVQIEKLLSVFVSLGGAELGKSPLY